MEILWQAVLGLAAAYVVYVVLEALMAGKYMAAPRQAPMAKLLNALLWPSWKLGLGPFKHRLDYAYMKAWAVRRCKADDFGDLEFEDNFQSTLEAIGRERITPLGHLGVWDQFSGRLTSRLRMEAMLARRPAIRSVEVSRPLFVMGLPRTGTTYLHRLLSLDPLTRYPKTWELLHPSPTNRDASSPEELAKDAAGRIAKVRRAIKRIKLVAPGLDAVHKTGAELPEECLFAVSMEFPLMPFGFYSLHRPDMMPKVVETRSPKMYTRYKDVLRILTWQSPDYPTNAGLRWTLKAPNHLLYIKQLTEAFQDARIVWTHRTVVDAIPSWCSLVRVLTDACLGERLDLEMIGGVTDRAFVQVIRRAIDELEEAVRKYDVKKADVLYDDLIRDPIGEVRRLYEELGYDFTPEFSRRLEQYIAKNQEERAAMKGAKKTLHSYSPEEFGLTPEGLLERYDFYHKHFSIPA